MYLHGKYSLYKSYINNNREHKKTEFLRFSHLYKAVTSELRFADLQSIFLEVEQMFHLLNCYVVHYDDCPVFAFSWPSVLTTVSVSLKAEVPALMSSSWMRPTADQQQKQSDWLHLSRESRHTHPTTTTTMGVYHPHSSSLLSPLR